MSKKYSMNNQYEKSLLGINIAKKYLSINPKVKKVIDVEDNEDFRKDDIDLVALMVDKNNVLKKCFIEVKCDTYASQNLYFETISNKNKNTPGCLLYSKAHFLFYYFEKYKKLYILPMKKFREWFLKNKNNFTKKEVFTKSNNSNEIYYSSEGYIIPLDSIHGDFLDYQLVDIELSKEGETNAGI